MKNLLRPIFAAIFVALAATSASTPSDAARRSTLAAYDGEWSVVIYTLRGDCDRSLRYSVRIVNGRVAAEDQSYQIYGAVKSGGDIRVTVAEGGRWASGVGRLSGNQGRGQWRTSTGQCAGQWTAVRRFEQY